MKWNSNSIEFRGKRPKPKKITGTRFASVLDMDRWASPFQVWCEITKAYNRPFEGNKYTEAGQTLEPKIIAYLKEVYFDDIITPQDVYGPDPFKVTWGDFFKKESAIFGGMWDALVDDGDGNIDGVIEIKTSKRVEDWANGAPVNQALQGALYAHLLGTDKVYMVGMFLQDEDYDNLDHVEPNSSNVVVDAFTIYDRFPMFDAMIAEAEAWWAEHVETGISPPFNEKTDAEYLKALRTTATEIGNLDELIAEAERLGKKVESYKTDIDRLKQLEGAIKEELATRFDEGSNRVTVKGKDWVFELARGTTRKVDAQSLKDDGLYDKYITTTESYRLTKKEIN